MTKLHFEDLTQITCPFGMLDDDTQERFEDHSRSGGEVEEYKGQDVWVKYNYFIGRERVTTMNKLHFEDLTKITCPFGMLDDDTQERFEDYAILGDVDIFLNGVWQDDPYETRNFGYTYRAKPKPQRLVTWLQWDEDDEALCCEDRHEADHCLKLYGGYIYRIERDEDGSNPTIELVEVGGKDE